MVVKLLETAFDPGAEANAFMAGRADAGAAVTFTGLVRSLPDDPVARLTLECYPELAERQIAEMIATATERFGLLEVTVIHRYGPMAPGEPIMQVMVLSAHREAAFDGARMLMDYLKTDAPFWKKEEIPGGHRWVEATAEDDEARDRWVS
jgi:molybdopterin synthase catalytic subunit